MVFLIATAIVLHRTWREGAHEKKPGTFVSDAIHISARTSITFQSQWMMLRRWPTRSTIWWVVAAGLFVLTGVITIQLWRAGLSPGPVIRGASAVFGAILGRTAYGIFNYQQDALSNC
jgi:hypothetical protein